MLKYYKFIIYRLFINYNARKLKKWLYVLFKNIILKLKNV